MTDLGRAGVYAAAWPPATVLAFVAEDLAIGAANGMGVRNLSWSIGLALNVMPALVAALALYVPVAFRLHRGGTRNGWSGHLVRGSILYGLVVLLGLWMIVSSPSSDFWMVFQLMLWPAVAAIAGALADLLVWGLRAPIGARPA